MAKKKRLQPTAPTMTRGQLSRAARERKQMRNLYIGVFSAIGVAVLVLGIAVFSTLVLRPSEEVASVNGEKITRATYNKLRRWNVYQDYLVGQAQGSSTSTTTDLSQQLRSVDTDPLDATTVNQLVDNTILRQKAASDLQISLTHDELKTDAIKDFIPQPTAPTTPEPTVVSGTTNLTPTATLTFTPGPPTNTPTKTATLPPVPGGQQTAEATYSNRMGSLANTPGLSEDDYLTLIVEPRSLQTRVTDKLAAMEVQTTTEQIHAQHILTDTEEGANKIIQMLDTGKDFTQLANTQSSEQLNNIKNGGTPNGGDLGWFPQKGSNYVQEFVDPAFKVETGKYSKTPAKTTFGYHVIKVLERDPHRPLTDSEISTAKSNAYQDWLTKAKGASVITTKLPASQPVATQPPAQEPTQPLVETPAATAPPGQAITSTQPISK